MNEDQVEVGSRVPRPSQLTPGTDCVKEARPRDLTYIDRAPHKQVVLSPLLENLARQVGGCQTEQVLELVRGIMFEVISQRKY